MSAANLAGQVVMGPLSFDVPQDYLQLQYSLDTNKLDTTLVNLSQTVARNAKVTNSLKDEIGALRAHIDNNVQKLQRSIAVLDDGSRALKEQLLRVYDEVKALQGATVRRHEYEIDKDLLWREHRLAKDFMEDYHKSQGHIERVQTWVRDFLPAWHAGVSKTAADHLERRLAESRAETREAVTEDIKTAALKVSETTKDLAALVDTRLASVDARHEGLEFRVTDAEAKHTRQQQIIAVVSGGIDDVKNGLRETANRVDEVAFVSAGQLDAALAVFGMTLADVKRFVDADALIADRRASAQPSRPGQPRRGGGGGVATNLGGADPEPDVIAAAVKDAAAATAYCTSLAPLKASATTASEAAAAAAEALCTKMRFELSSVSQQVKLEMADKVGVSKLRELLEKGKDERLYRTVETLQREVATVKESKVDVARFDNAMSAKADRAALDAKADRQFVETAVSHAVSKAEMVAAELEPLRVFARDVSQGRIAPNTAPPTSGPATAAGGAQRAGGVQGSQQASPTFSTPRHVPLGGSAGSNMSPSAAQLAASLTSPMRSSHGGQATANSSMLDPNMSVSSGAVRRHPWPTRTCGAVWKHEHLRNAAPRICHRRGRRAAPRVSTGFDPDTTVHGRRRCGSVWWPQSAVGSRR
jgi:hypothetical protein